MDLRVVDVQHSSWLLKCFCVIANSNILCGCNSQSHLDFDPSGGDRDVIPTDKSAICVCVCVLVMPWHCEITAYLSDCLSSFHENSTQADDLNISLDYCTDTDVVARNTFIASTSQS